MSESTVYKTIASRLRVVARLGRNANLRRLALSYLGYKLTELASWIVILVFAYERGGVVESGVVAAAMYVPPSLITPFASAAGDRFPKGRALAACFALVAISSFLCATALALEWHDFVVYGAMLALCIGISVSQPFLTSALVAFSASAEDVSAANVVNGLIESASYFLGPLIAALLLPKGGPWTVFGVLVLPMILSVGLALRIEDASPGSAPLPERLPVWKSFASAARWATHEADVPLLLFVSAGHQMLIGSMDVLFVAIAFDLLRTGDSGAALLNASFGAGLFGGALLSIGLIGSRRIGAYLVAGGLASGLVLVPLASATTQAAALPLLVLVGVGALVTDMAASILVQRVIPPDRMSPALGILESASLIALTLGMLGMAGLVDRFGVRVGVAALGLGLLGLGLLLYVPIRRLDSKYGPPPAEIVSALRTLAIFRPLGALAIEQLARSASKIGAQPGEVLIRQGDPGGSFFVLLEGSVTVEEDSVLMRRQGPGEFFGEISALRGVPRTATVVAETPVQLIELDSSRFVRAVSSHPRTIALTRRIAREREFGSSAPLR